MVNLRDLVNPIPAGMSFKYKVGDNVCHNGKCWTVHKHRDCNGAPSYLLSACRTQETLDKVLESECEDCCSTNVLEEGWADFVYIGDNLRASNFVFQLAKRTSCCKGIKYGPNSDNTAYILRYCCEVENVEKTLIKNKTDIEF